MSPVRKFAVRSYIAPFLLAFSILCSSVFVQTTPVMAAESISHMATTNIEHFPTTADSREAAALGATQLSLGSGALETDVDIGTITLDQPVNSLGIHWNGSAPNGTTVEFEALIDGRSYSLSASVDDTKTDFADDGFAGPVVFPATTTVQLRVHLGRVGKGIASPVVEDLNVTTYLADDSSPQTLFGITSTSDRPVQIISRQQIGYDETLGIDSSGDPIWPLEQKKITQIIVHHTAGGTGDGNGAAVARSLYYWHSAVLGWGDIGYNFLIDADGNIYKGRKGALGAVGGHAYNSKTNTNLNPNSVGIALMGCYEHDPNDCPTQDSMTPEMAAALEQLVGWIANEANIDVTEVHDFKGTSAERLSDHRAFDATLCPGNSVDASLADIRLAAMDFSRSITTQPWQTEIHSASVDGVDVGSLVGISAKKSHTLQLTYTNSGTKTWTGTDVRLKLYRKDGQKATRLRKVNWPDSYGKFTMIESTVAPGDVATFIVPLGASKKITEVTLVHTLVHGKTAVRKSRTSTTLPFNRNFVGAVTGSELPLGVFVNDSVTGTLTVQNTGIKPWKSPVEVFVNGTWVHTVAAQVEPGSSTEFPVPIPTASLGAVLPEDRVVIITLRQSGNAIRAARLAHSYAIHELRAQSAR